MEIRKCQLIIEEINMPIDEKVDVTLSKRAMKKIKDFADSVYNKTRYGLYAWVIAAAIGGVAPTASATFIDARNMIDTDTRWEGHIDITGLQQSDGYSFAGSDWIVSVSQIGSNYEDILIQAKHLVAPHTSELAPNPNWLEANLFDVYSGHDVGIELGVTTDWVLHTTQTAGGNHINLLRTYFNSDLSRIFITLDHLYTLDSSPAPYVPEPATVLLLALGGLGLRRRRKVKV